MRVKPKTDAFPYPTLDVKVPAILADLKAIIAGGSSYKMGAKCPPSTDPKDVDAIDCSGLVRYLLIRAGVGDFPDGSYIQHEAIRKAGCKPSTVAALDLGDEVLRVAFLPPQDGAAGHVALWYNGLSIESHGGVGPDRRTVAKCLHWLSASKIYVLTPPVK